MPFPGFVDEFTNSPVAPAYASFLNVVVPAPVAPATFVNVQLEWSFANPNTLYPFSQNMLVSVNALAANIINFPDATMTSISQTTNITNMGAEPINIYTFPDPTLGATLIVTIASLGSVNIYCTDNTTTRGQWQAVVVGGGGTIVAANLIDTTTTGNPYGWENNDGLGSFAPNYLGLKMNVNRLTVPTANYMQTLSDRGSILVWETGNGNYIPLRANVPAMQGFMWGINNSLSTISDVTVIPQGRDMINDSINPLILSSGTSALFFCDGNGNFYTITGGSGGSSVQALLGVPVNNGPVTILATQESANLILEFTGGATGNSTITFPGGTVYTNYIWNNSTDTLHLLVSGSLLPTINVLPNQRIIVFSDRTNLYVVPTVAGAPQFPDGTQAAPSITFLNDTALGLYRNTTTQPAPAADSLTIVQANISIADLTSNGVFPNVQVLGFGGTQTTPTYSFKAQPTSGMRFTGTAPIGLQFVAAGVEVLRMTSAPQVLAPLGTSVNPSYGFAANVGTGMYASAAGANIVLGAAGSTVLNANAGTTQLQASNTVAIQINGTSNITTSLVMLGINGAANAPAYSFSNNTQTGLYLGAGDVIVGISLAANSIFTGAPASTQIAFGPATTTLLLNATNVVVNQPILAPVSATPSYSFTGFTTTGMYLNASILGLSNQGNSILTASNTITNIWSNNVVNMTFNNNTNITTTIPFYVPNGAVATPSDAFANKTNTGMFYDGTFLNFSFNGASIMNTNGNVTTSNVTGDYVFNIGGVAYFNIGVANYNYTYADMNAHSSALQVNGATFRQEDINIYSLMRAYG